MVADLPGAVSWLDVHHPGLSAFKESTVDWRLPHDILSFMKKELAITPDRSGDLAQTIDDLSEISARTICEMKTANGNLKRAEGEMR